VGEGITGRPNEYDFGLEFDYAVWPKDTQIDLVNVPWDNNYRDVVRFGTPQNPQSLDSYIDSLNGAGIRLTKLSYVKPSEPIRVNIPHNRAIKYNYLRAKNPVQPVPGNDEIKNYYYFILDVRYIAPNTTELVLQLDVWQTYIYDITLGRCYVERGHVGIANQKQFDNYGRDYLTVPEGLDIGSEYTEVALRQVNPMNFNNADIMVVSTTDLLAESGTVANPVLTSAPGSIISGTVSGASIYIWENPSLFSQWLASMKLKPWVTQGIISITMIPSIERYFTDYSYDGDGIEPSTPPPGPIERIKSNLWPDWRTHIVEGDVWTSGLPIRYRHLLKFLTYPFMAIEFTTYAGASVILKPESWRSKDGGIIEMANIVPPSQKVGFMPQDYNDNAKPFYDGFDHSGDFVNVAIWINNFPTLPIVNDGAINYMASNRATIGWQKANAEWTQNRALGMAQGNYDVASGGMNATRSLNDISVSADRAQQANANRTQAAQAIVGMVGSAAGGAASGVVFGPPGMIGGGLAGTVQGAANGLNAAIGIASNDEALAIRTGASRSSTDTNVSQQGLVRDTNKNLADWAARGDYAQAIGGINARVQDAALTQPSMSGAAGGEFFNLVNQMVGLYAKWKMLDSANMKIIGEYWLRYGYAIRSNMIPPSSLMVMTNFTYWKMVETYISSANVPEGFKQAIRGIFEKGVTVWANPADIGFIDWADNAPLTGVTY
jgi:hypothetical protein